MILRRLVSLLVLLVALVACRTSGADTPAAVTATSAPAVEATSTTAVPATSTSVPPSPTQASPTQTATAPSATETVAVVTDVDPTATATSAPSATATTPPATATVAPTATTVTSGLPERPDEAILILEPGPGSRVLSPIRLRGEADSTFEQTLVVRLVTADGTELDLRPTNIQADLGERGPFEVEIPFTVSGEQNAFIQVFAESPRDGGITHLSSVGVTLASSGAANIIPVTPQPERIAIFEPAPGDVIRGGTVHIEGVALASFEQTLMVDIMDVDGNYVGRQTITVNAPDLGQPGTFSVDVPYTVTSEGPGRIVVRDPSAAFNGTVHLSSVGVTLAP